MPAKTLFPMFGGENTRGWSGKFWEAKTKERKKIKRPGIDPLWPFVSQEPIPIFYG